MKLRTITKFTVLLFLGGIIVVLVIKTNIKIRQYENNNLYAQTLPYFEFYRSVTAMFSSKSLLPGKPVVIIWFNPLCEHCTYETGDILKNFVLFRDIDILFISDAGHDLLAEFSFTYRLDTIPQIRVLQSGYDYFATKFGNPPSVPTTYIYNKEHRLVKVFLGEASVQAIIRAISEHNKTPDGEMAKN